jgi:hypothetical protein
LKARDLLPAEEILTTMADTSRKISDSLLYASQVYASLLAGLSFIFYEIQYPLKCEDPPHLSLNERRVLELAFILNPAGLQCLNSMDNEILYVSLRIISLEAIYAISETETQFPGAIFAYLWYFVL